MEGVGAGAQWIAPKMHEALVIAWALIKKRKIRLSLLTQTVTNLEDPGTGFDSHTGLGKLASNVTLSSAQKISEQRLALNAVVGQEEEILVSCCMNG